LRHWQRENLERWRRANPDLAAPFATTDQPWRGPPGHHQCLEPDGEIIWMADTVHDVRQRALEESLRSKCMPAAAIEAILWMNGESQRRASLDDAEPVKPVQRRRRKPTLAHVVKQAVKAGIEVAGYEVRDGSIKVITGKPSEATTIEAEPLANEWDDVLIR
jgi:hypothetical protein